MKKWITVIALLVFVLLTGCSEKQQAPALNPVVLSEVRDTVLQEMNIQEPFLLETEALMNLYGIDAQWVASSAGFVTMNGTFPDEVIFVEAADEASAEQIRTKLQGRLDEVLVQSQTYDAENYALAQACTVMVDETYVCLILSPNHEQIAELYRSSLYSE